MFVNAFDESLKNNCDKFSNRDDENDDSDTKVEKTLVIGIVLGKIVVNQ